MQKLNCWQFNVCTAVLMFLYSPCYDTNRSCQRRRKGVLDAKASTVIWMDDDARWSQPFAPWQISLKYWSFHTESMDVDWKATDNASEAWSSFIIRREQSKRLLWYHLCIRRFSCHIVPGPDTGSCKAWRASSLLRWKGLRSVCCCQLCSCCSHPEPRLSEGTVWDMPQWWIVG